MQINTKCLLSLYVKLQQKLTGSNLGRDVSSIQVSWKSLQQFSCNPAEKPTNEWTLAPTLVCVCTARYRQKVKCSKKKKQQQIIISINRFVLTSEKCRSVLPKPETTSLNVLSCLQPKDTQFAVTEEERNQEIFTFKTLSCSSILHVYVHVIFMFLNWSRNG